MDGVHACGCPLRVQSHPGPKGKPIRPPLPYTRQGDLHVHRPSTVPQHAIPDSDLLQEENRCSYTQTVTNDGRLVNVAFTVARLQSPTIQRSTEWGDGDPWTRILNFVA